MDEMLKEIPPALHDRFTTLVALTDAFCAAHLNDEYRQVCRDMAVAFCQKGSPVTKGKSQGWAAGIVWAAGWVNFLRDPSQKPHMKGEEVAEGFGVSVATMQVKSRDIRAGLNLQAFDPDFTVPSLQKQNPLIWMVQLQNGMIADIRSLPREVQVEALMRGMIPYIPADRKDGDGTGEGAG